MKNLSFFGHSVLVLHIVLGTFSIWPTISSMPWPTLASTRHVPLPPTDYSFTNTTLLVQQQISGVVADAQGPLPAVTITVKNSNAVAITDVNGHYTIAALPSDILVFSLLGYKTVEIPVGSQEQINATLVEDATALQEVTVNAGYYTVKDKERTGSIATIKAADIEKQPVANVLATMQGRMAGVNIVQESGIAGGGFTINIRGVNSLRSNGNNPLYVIDGVPYSSDAISDLYVSMALPGDGNPLSSINPADIISLEILKDADATAIYGSRGANGVVLITTRRGKAGPTVFNLSSSYGVGKVTRMLKMMNTEQYQTMRNQAFANDGAEPQFYDYDVTTWDPTRYTDWQKELIGGTAEMNTWQASASGGSEKTRFLLSGNHHTETTVFPGDSKYKRSGAHLSVDHTSDNGKFQMGFSGYYTAQRNDLPGKDLTYLARTLAPNAPAVYDENGELNWEDNTWDNPLAQLREVNLSAINDLVANTVLSWQLTKSLGFRSNFGFTDLRNEESRIYPSTIYNPAYNVGAEYSNATFNTFSRQSWTIEPQLNWKMEFGNSRIDLLGGSTFQQQRSAKLSHLAYGYSSNSLIYDLSAASNVTLLNNDKLEYKYQALFGRFNYAYRDRYFVNITGRRDGSSRFGPGKQFATFGAVGAAWIFSKEKFAANSRILSFGKLRSSYGTTGNDQIGDYQFLNTYSSSSYDYQGVSGLMPSRLYNPHFGWETNKKFEVALETGFLKDHLFLTAAWYRNRSSSQLVGNPLPGTTGFTSIQANLDATVENSGFELGLRNVLFDRKDFGWSSSINFTLPKNKLISFPGLGNSTYRNRFVIGEPITIQKFFRYTGIDPETGIYQFEDVNGDGRITFEDDRSVVRDFTPDFYGGIENQFRYKGVSLDFLFQFVKQLNYNFAATYGFTGYAVNQPAAYADSWSQPGDNASYQVFTAGFNPDAIEASNNFLQSDATVSDASYIRLKNVALSYTLPAGSIQDVQLRFTLQGQNLLTFTKYNGADPEFKDAGFLPPLRVISGGIHLTF